MISFFRKGGGSVQLLIWGAIYLGALWALGRTVRPWCSTSWYKLAFLPGTLIAAALDTAATLLCTGRVKRWNFFRNGKSFVETDNSRLPHLAGGLCVLWNHVACFVLYAALAGALAERGHPCAAAAQLPHISPSELLAGELGELATTPYLFDVGAWMRDTATRPLDAALLLYFALAAFASLPLSGAQWRSSALTLGAFATAAATADWFGVGVRLFSRGWWASWFYGDTWWSTFSSFLTLAFGTLIIAVGLRLLLALWRRAVASHANAQRARPVGRPV